MSALRAPFAALPTACAHELLAFSTRETQRALLCAWSSVSSARVDHEQAQSYARLQAVVDQINASGVEVRLRYFKD